MQFETEEPAHGGLSRMGHIAEHPVAFGTLGMTHAQHRGVDEADACTLTPTTMVDEQHERYAAAVAQFNEAVVRYNSWETIPHAAHDKPCVEGFEIAVAAALEQDEDSDYLGFAKTCLPLPCPALLALLKAQRFELLFKFKTEIVNTDEYLSSFGQQHRFRFLAVRTTKLPNTFAAIYLYINYLFTNSCDCLIPNSGH
jgi:hypothetical protein